MLDRDKNMRQNIIKIFRLLIDSPNALAMLRSKHIYIFLAKALERESKQEIFNENI